MPKNKPFKDYYVRYEKWFVDHAPLYDAEMAAIKKFIPGEGMGLEVGVGSGLFSNPLGVRFGIDPCREMLSLARKRNINVSLGRAEALPCKSGKFAYILMVTVACFFDDPRKAFREAKRVLVDGGKLVVAFIDRKSPMGQEYEANQAESTFYKGARFLSSEEMVEMLEEAGFDNFSFRQCLVSKESKEKKEIRILPGYGKGVFVVLEARMNEDS